MAIVVDVSAIVPLAFADESHAFSEALIHRLAREGGIVPPLFWFEIENVLAINVTKRKRISSQQAGAFMAQLEQLRLVTSPLPDMASLLGMAISMDIVAYDAAYLELAQRLASPLATLDGKLIAAAQQASVQLFQVD